MTENVRTEKEIKKFRRAALIVVLLTSFTMSLIGSALNLSIPAIGREFQVTADTVGWMVTGFLLCVAAFSVPFGRLSDITCRKNVLVTGMIVFICTCAGAVFALNFAMLLVFRIVQAIGAAMVLSSNTPILISAYPPEKKGKALGLAIGSVYVGLSVGPVIGGVLNHQFGWRSIFIAAGSLMILTLIVAIARLPHIDSEGKGKIQMDLGGSALFAAFIIMFMLGLSKIEFGMIPITMVIIGLVLGGIFVYYEIHKSNPVLDVRLFKSNIGYALSNIAALLNYAATFAIGYLTSIYLQVALGYDSQTAGIIMIAQPLVMAVLTPKIGRISDKRSPFKLSSLGMGFCALGTLFFVFVRTDTSLVYIVIALVITGIGFALFSSPNTNAILSCVDRKDYGVANSVVSTMRSVGQTLSMVIVTIIVTFMMPGVELAQTDPESLVTVINTAFTVFAAMCIIGIFISLKRKSSDK
ncbi:MAG: MFS transporter [Clostridia bacterium]|nr:MFS transporter [Clostridia bacterium]